MEIPHPWMFPWKLLITKHVRIIRRGYEKPDNPPDYGIPGWQQVRLVK